MSRLGGVPLREVGFKYAGVVTQDHVEQSDGAVVSNIVGVFLFEKKDDIAF